MLSLYLSFLCLLESLQVSMTKKNKRGNRDSDKKIVESFTCSNDKYVIRNNYIVYRSLAKW